MSDASVNHVHQLQHLHEIVCTQRSRTVYSCAHMYYTSREWVISFAHISGKHTDWNHKYTPASFAGVEQAHPEVSHILGQDACWWCSNVIRTSREHYYTCNLTTYTYWTRKACVAYNVSLVTCGMATALLGSHIQTLWTMSELGRIVSTALVSGPQHVSVAVRLTSFVNRCFEVGWFMYIPSEGQYFSSLWWLFLSYS